MIARKQAVLMIYDDEDRAVALYLPNGGGRMVPHTVEIMDEDGVAEMHGGLVINDSPTKKV